MKTRFFVLMTVGDEASDQMDHEIGGTAVTRMLNQGDVFELVNDRFNNRTFTYQHFIREVHETIFHVLT